MKTAKKILRFILALPFALVLFGIAYTVGKVYPRARLCGLWALYLLGIEINVQ